MTRPLAIDLFCGLGGWTEGLLAEGYEVMGFDIERHKYGEHCYPAQLVVQDVLTLHGSQFKDAALIVASPPCQEFSYMAMPWTRAKQIARALRGDGDFPEGYRGSRTIADLTRLFDASFRIQREACEAAGRHIPLVVENVKGAQPWVGRARAKFGSFYLWGDVPALMPSSAKRSLKRGVAHRGPDISNFDGIKRSGRTMCFPAGSANPDAVMGRTGKLHWQDDAIKNNGGSGFAIGSPGQKVVGQNPDGRKTSRDGLGSYGGGFGWDGSPMRRGNSKSSARKFASAMIAKIPLTLSRHVAATYRPEGAPAPAVAEAA